MPFDKKLLNQSIKYSFIYSMTGLFLGLVCIVSGVVLFLNGIVGATSWTANFFGSESTISDAAPGVILFVVGLFVIVATRYRIKIHRGVDKYGKFERVMNSRRSQIKKPKGINSEPSEDNHEDSTSTEYLDIPSFLRNKAD